MPYQISKPREDHSRETFGQTSQIAIGLMIITLCVLAGYIGTPREITGDNAVSSDVNTKPYQIGDQNGEEQSQITIGTDFTKPDYQFIKRLKSVYRG